MVNTKSTRDYLEKSHFQIWNVPYKQIDSDEDNDSSDESESDEERDGGEEKEEEPEKSQEVEEVPEKIVSTSNNGTKEKEFKHPKGVPRGKLMQWKVR